MTKLHAQGLSSDVHRRVSVKKRGFTLIELMIVIAIIAIFAAMTYPRYGDYIRKSRRTAATTALVQAQTELEKLYGQQGSYRNAICSDQSGGDVPTGKRKVCALTTPDGGDYTLALTVAPNNQRYSITATAPENTRQQKDKRCGSFTITQADTGRGSALSLVAGGETATNTTQECW